MTLASYKRGMGVLARSSKNIEAAGGLKAYLEQNPVEFMRIFPARKDQMRTETGDTILDTDSESFLLNKALADARQSGGVMTNIESMLAAAAASGSTAGGMVNLPTNSGDPLGEMGYGPGGYGAGSEGAEAGPGGPHAAAPVPAAAPDAAPAVATPGTPGGIMNMVEGYFSQTLMEGPSEQRSYVELAKVIQEMRPDFVLQHFPPKRREELRHLPPEQMAAEIIEDSAVKWAVERLQTAPTGEEAIIVEEEVLRVLTRSLQATQAADRLLQKLVQYVSDMGMPINVTARIREELEWTVVPLDKKIEQLTSREKFDRLSFRRLLDLIAEMIKAGEFEKATHLAQHYMRCLDPGREPDMDDLARVPELLRVMARVRTTFWPSTVELLIAALKREQLGEVRHLQVVNAIISLSKAVAIYEDFSLIVQVGQAMEAQVKVDAHRECCFAGLRQLLTPTNLERLVEIFIARKEDASWIRTTALLLRWSGELGIGRAFKALSDEVSASNRLALLRMLSRIGPAAIELALQRLTDDRWFVVRNACKLLAELKDPYLIEHVSPLLSHTDERVQKAAVLAINETRLPERALVFAETLSFLAPHVLEDVMTELRFLKSPDSFPGLEDFVLRSAHGNTKSLLLAVNTLAVIPDERVPQLLASIMGDDSLDLSVRRSALVGLQRFNSPVVLDLLLEFASGSRRDPLIPEAERALRSKTNPAGAV
jgi:HEAT repeat protein